MTINKPLDGNNLRHNMENSNIKSIADGDPHEDDGARKISEQEEYKREQKERLAEYVIGGKDSSGNLISNIYSRGDEYVIYEISGVSEPESFRVYIDTVIESDPEGLIAKFEAIKGEITDFRSVLYKGVHDKSVKHRAANAVSTALRGDLEKAREIFAKITTQMTKEYKAILIGRLLYLSGAMAFIGLALVYSLIIYYFRESRFVQHIPMLRELIYAATFSGCGGLLSVCINFQEIQFERELGDFAYFTYGAQRMLVAGLCGLFTYMLIKSGILFSFLLKSENPFITLMALCAAAGFSETLIPNALKNLEKKGD